MHCVNNAGYFRKKGEMRMICDLSTVLNHDGAVLDISGTVSFAEDAFGRDVSFADGVSVSGSITCRGNVLELCAHVEGAFLANCARCLKELKEELSFDFSETLVQEGDEVTDRDSVIVFAGMQIDLSDIVVSNILLHMDYRYLCSDDCRGICPKCGADLNQGDCGCVNDAIDPRWEKLKNFQ